VIQYGPAHKHPKHSTVWILNPIFFHR